MLATHTRSSKLTGCATWHSILLLHISTHEARFTCYTHNDSWVP